MGWFDANDSDYNKALTHYRTARDLLPNGSLYYKEMSIASSYLKELIRKTMGLRMPLSCLLIFILQFLR